MLGVRRNKTVLRTLGLLYGHSLSYLSGMSAIDRSKIECYRFEEVIGFCAFKATNVSQLFHDALE